jgi:hypothetical protein
MDKTLIWGCASTKRLRAPGLDNRAIIHICIHWAYMHTQGERGVTKDPTPGKLNICG